MRFSKHLLSWVQIFIAAVAFGFILYLLYKVDVTNPEEDRHGFVLAGIFIFGAFSLTNILAGLITKFVKYGPYIGSVMSLGSFFGLYFIFYG